MAKPPRSILKFIFTNFINSFRPRQFQGNFIGEDYFGNKYFEIPAEATMGKRKAERWFVPYGDKNAFDSELTAEWESWLRGRRKEPPTNEELRKNLAIIQMKKINAAKLEEKFPTPQLAKTGAAFPSYPEYESAPGKKPRGEQ